MDLLYESSIEAFYARDGRAAFALAAEQDDAGATEKFAGESSRDAGDVVETFLLGHGSDDATDHSARWPAALTPPVARPFDSWNWNSGVHQFDAVARHSCPHHRCLHCVRNRDEGIDAVAILDPYLLGRKSDASCDD